MAPPPMLTARQTDNTEAPVMDLRDQARELSGLALTTLGAIMRGQGPDTVRLAAAREVLDRAYGKARAVGGDPEPEGLTVVIRRFGEDGEADSGGAGDQTS